PKCVSGACNYGERAAQACTSITTLGTTLDCLPPLKNFQAPLPVTLNPLTTGTGELTAAAGQFCTPQTTPGAFGVANAQCTAAGTPYGCCTGSGTGACDVKRIAETGTPAGNLTDHM